MKWIFWTRAINWTVPLRDCEFSAVAVAPAVVNQIPDVIGYYDRVRDYVKHEDDLINSRLTWSLTIHGFLFAIYGILMVKITELCVPRHDNPGLPASLGRVIALLFFLQAPIAAFGAVVGFLSREAIAAAHNSIQHLLAISQASGVLQTLVAQTDVAAGIAQGQSWVKPTADLGITMQSRVLVDDRSDGNEEIVNVLAAGNGRFEAVFAKAHDAGALIKPLGMSPLLLAKVVSGGDKGYHTGGARLYYLKLPLCATIIWALLLLFSLISGCLCYFHGPQFFAYLIRA